MKKAGILGFGLIGGSIALALKNRLGMEIAAFSRSEKPLKEACESGIVSNYSVSDLSVFSDCDIIFVCTPVGKICGYVESLIPLIKKDCIITDVGSTKGKIFKKLNEYKNINYIGAHPMAGSEKTGFTAAKEDLYENAFYILTPSETVSGALVEEYTSLIKAIGAIPVVIDPYKHDHIVAAVSHLPHIIAASLVNTVEALDDDGNMHTLAAGGFRDITRIASSSAEMWSSICSENKTEILNVLESFENSTKAFKDALISENYSEISNLFNSAKEYRDSFEIGRGRGTCKSNLIKIDIKDHPGAIAEAAALLAKADINIKNIGIINNRDYSDGVMRISLESYEALKKAEKVLSEKG
ncbi:MAG: prephenate dehydrogenase/arogenate dehydrogenase family protein [Clostridiales bacterium]|nr:prephenate dehydrogenase/arogenate dehydrogenase family protein [Clostridiales bacterium]